MNILIILSKHKLTWKNSLCYEISHWQKFAYIANGIYINHIQHKLLYSIADFFPYNESNGDERLRSYLRHLRLEVPVNIFNTLEYDLYVSGNKCYYKMVVFNFIWEYRYRLPDSFHFGILFIHIHPCPSQKVLQILVIL